MNTTFIYSLEHPLTGEIRYIGKTVNIYERYRRHLRDSINPTIHCHCWIRSLLNDNLKPVIRIIDEVPKDEWQFWEIYWIGQMKAWGCDLTNISKGGEGGQGRKKGTFTDEERKNKSERMKISNPMYNEETRKRVSITQSGKEHSEESKKKISDKLKGRIFTKEHKNNLSLAGKERTCKPLSDETKKKISNKLKGRIVSDETKNKLSQKSKERERDNKGHYKIKL